MAKIKARNRPAHIPSAVDEPCRDNAAWVWNVVHKKAPGAINAMALTVTPVNVRLRRISPALVSAMHCAPLIIGRQWCPRPMWAPVALEVKVNLLRFPAISEM